MNFILFDDASWVDLLPITFTRPVSEIRWGILTLREKWEHYLQQPCSYLTRSYLQPKFPCREERDSLFINGAIAPDKNLVSAILALKPDETLMKNKEIIAVRMDDADFALPELPGPVGGKRIIPYAGEYLRLVHTWDIFRLNGQAILSDFELITSGRTSRPLPPEVHVTGSFPVFLEKGATISHAYINTNQGPVYIAEGAEVMEGCMIRGPFSLGKASVLKMGSKVYGPTTIGPTCKAGGEINNSVIQGYSNKAHEGYLGNSVIGEWCNLGADTNNSNLKNSFAPVKTWSYRTRSFIETGLLKCGLVMGDYSRCGINTMFNMATVVGVGVNLFGAGFPRNYVPSFSYGGAQGFKVHPLDKVLEAADGMMKQQQLALSEADRRILADLFEFSRNSRYT